MNYNFHTHTTRCGHAEGTPEEYVKRAIENGIEVMGFSDHAPYVFPNGYSSGFRVPMDEAADYIAEISALREKYRGYADIKIGFEAEYYQGYFPRLLQEYRKCLKS